MTTEPSKARLVLLIIVVGLLGLATGATAWRYFSAPSIPERSSLIVLPEPRIIADFALTDQDGNAFNLADFKGHWSVLFFGFTSCPDVCPNTLYQLKQARQEMLASLAGDELPKIYLVSVVLFRSALFIFLSRLLPPLSASQALSLLSS